MAQIDIYTREFCPYCTRALGLLKQKGVDFTQIDAGMNAEKKSEMVQRANGGRTFPQVFVGDVHVGGCDDLFAMERAGKLDELLKAS